MDDFDEIYTISHDDTTKKAPVAKKSVRRPIIILSGIGMVFVIILFLIITNRQTISSDIIVSGRHPKTNTQSLIVTPSAQTQHTMVQDFFKNAGTILNPTIAPVGKITKPNWETFPAGTEIQSQTISPTIVASSNNNPTYTSSNQTQTTTQSVQDNHIQLVFKDPNGQIEVYQQPTSSPTLVIWGRYVNAADHYSIDYPTNWQMIKTSYNGHEGISLYLPGASTNQNPEFIGFGLASYYLLPSQVNITTAYSSPITVNNVNGTLYTQGALGYSYIAAVFQYQSGYWGLGTTVSDPTFAYVYDHMINSVTFNN